MIVRYWKCDNGYCVPHPGMYSFNHHNWIFRLCSDGPILSSKYYIYIYVMVAWMGLLIWCHDRPFLFQVWEQRANCVFLASGRTVQIVELCVAYVYFYTYLYNYFTYISINSIIGPSLYELYIESLCACIPTSPRYNTKRCVFNIIFIIHLQCKECEVPCIHPVSPFQHYVAQWKINCFSTKKHRL